MPGHPARKRRALARPGLSRGVGEAKLWLAPCSLLPRKRIASLGRRAANFHSPTRPLGAASIKDYAYALGMFVITEADADAIRASSIRRESCRPLSSCACLCPEYRRVDAAASPAAPCNAAASLQGQIARLPSVSDAYAAAPHRPPKLARNNPVYRAPGPSCSRGTARRVRRRLTSYSWKRG
jgi:hypothetical protein